MLNTLQLLAHSISTTTPRKRSCYYPHFTNEETEVLSLSILLEVTQLVTRRPSFDNHALNHSLLTMELEPNMEIPLWESHLEVIGGFGKFSGKMNLLVSYMSGKPGVENRSDDWVGTLVGRGLECTSHTHIGTRSLSGLGQDNPFEPVSSSVI